MPRASLPPNGNHQALTDGQIDRMFLTFRHLDSRVNIRHVPGKRTCFVVTAGPEGDVAEICFGPDIHPGGGILDPNSIMTPQAAAAHEIAHYHRWAEGTEPPQGALDNIDEALTRLTAGLRFHDKLEWIDTRQLISHSVQRLEMHT